MKVTKLGGILSLCAALACLALPTARCESAVPTPSTTAAPYHPLPLLTLTESPDAESAREFAENALTEIYGYTEEEAARFIFQDTGEETLTFASPDSPDMVYTLRYSGNSRDLTSPFSTRMGRRVAEGDMRDILRAAEQGEWFSHWDGTSRQALAELLQAKEMLPSLELLGLLSGETAEGDGARALQSLLEVWLGDEAQWTDALCAWRDSLMARSGLQTPGRQGIHIGIQRYPRLPTRRVNRDTSLTVFCQELPRELSGLLNHPRLKGWACIAGAYTVQTTSNADVEPTGSGLAAFARGQERLLAALHLRDGAWEALPIGERTLLEEGTLAITYDSQNERYIVENLLPDGEEIRFHMLLEIHGEGMFRGALCSLRECERIQPSERQYTRISVDASGDNWNWHRISHGADDSVIVMVSYPIFLGAADIHDFPWTPEAARSMRRAELPEDCVVLSGVHFRAQTSSRSRDLGTLKPGTIVRVEGIAPGDPYDWIRTSMGPLTGYICSLYSSLEVTTSAATVRPLPVARTLRSTALKKGTGWFSGNVRELEPGERMHVLMEQGDWLYVAIPRGAFGWWMDVDGEYGYVKKSDVCTALTLAQMDWEAD